MARIVTEVDIDVDLDDFADDDIIEHLEERGYRVLFGKRKDVEDEIDSITDRIHNLYRDYVSGIDFDDKLKNFFSEQLDVIVR